MEKEQDKIDEQNQNIFLLGEYTFSKFSKEIFYYPIFGILCGIYLNYIYIYNWRKQKNIFSLFIILYMNFIIIKIISKKIFKYEEEKQNEENVKNNYELEVKKLRERFRKLMSLEDPSSTLRNFIYTYFCLIISRFAGDKFIIFCILNIYIFYTPINNKFPNFVFNCVMSLKQTIEGVFGIIECFIPRYVEKKKND